MRCDCHNGVRRSPAYWGLIGITVVALVTCVSGASTFADEAGWKAAWELREGFTIDVDAEGFRLPSSIAFVPEPGEDPKDPLYFVTELRKGVKVVTNDRTVYTFAEGFFRLRPEVLEAKRRPGYVPEEGVAGICLDPKTGYVFVSFSYYDGDDSIRYDIARFTTDPNTFSVEPDGMERFTDIFADQPGGDSHMIGPMAVVGDHLYVSVGDAQAPSLTQELNSAVGKVLRMTLDGDPVSENPHYQDSDRGNPANYVFARGFRNPFGLKVVQGDVFVNDVGPGVDRFVRVREGGNYYYDGSDMSIASHADIVFTPSPSPVQLDFLSEDNAVFPPEYRGRFYTAMSGLQGRMGPSEDGGKSVQMFRYDLERKEVVGRPETLVKYRGNGKQMPVGLAFGPDGLYMVALHPDQEGRTPVYRVSYNPDDAHPFVIDRAPALIQSKGCMGCHRKGDGAPAPPLDRSVLMDRIRDRISTPEYNERLKDLDELDVEPFSSYRAARQSVREARGVEKVRVWLKHQLLEPRFDDPDARMPNLGLTENEATTIADYLIDQEEQPRTLADAASQMLYHLIPEIRQRHLIAFFGLGGIAGAVGGVGISILARWMVRRQQIPQRKRLEQYQEA